MIITLVAHEKNLGLLALTDFLLEKLGRDNCIVMGSNYLIIDPKPMMETLEKHSQDNKSVIVKYIIPKQNFSNQDLVYPSELSLRSDLVVRVPKFIEELKRPVALEVLKGEGNPMLEKIREYYK